MRRKILLSLVASACAILPMSAADYKPMLEEGKSWIIGKSLKKTSYFLHPSPIMEEYVEFFECFVEDKVEVEGEDCWTVAYRRIGSETVSNRYKFLEKDGVLSIYSPVPRHPEVSPFLPVINFNCQISDSLLVYPIYYELEKIEPTHESYLFATDIRKAKGVDGQERREIIFENDRASYVEGIGATTATVFLFPCCYANSFGSEGIFIIECRKNGKTIFRNEDFAIPNRMGLHNVKTITPGKSWTMACGNKQFTVSVDRDTLINAINCIVLKSSEGKEYIVAEENGRVYAFADHLGKANPLRNALMLSDTNYYISVVKRTDWTTGEVTDWERRKGDGKTHWQKNGTNELTVNGRTFTEYLISEGSVDAESGEVVASWVEGVGAPDAQSWATQMPEGYDLRMIDCRQDGEVIFTAEDFTHKSGIAEVTADRAERSGIYDLQGRRVSSPGRGLYIVDGKKTLLR